MSSSDDEATYGGSISTSPSRAPAGGFAPGHVVAGRYRLVALLGRGGMGEVYRADDLTLDQAVALKFLPEGVADDPDRLSLFHNELRIARQVTHKNVCRLFDLGESGGRRFLTMQYVDGEDLSSLLRRVGRVPHDRAVEIARQMCAGLAAAHEQGVIHRDLKPANIMVDGEGRALISDFGLALSASDHASGFAGTPHYMSPEQLAGSTATTRSDIYALGLVLYELFTGKRAHSGRTLDELRRQHESGAIATPSSVLHDIDPTVERIVLRCLERDPEKRPTSALAVAASLPGANPIADALAAGLTPSPDMLAAAGELEALPAWRGLAGVGLVVAGLIAMLMLAPRATEVRLMPLDRPGVVLADRAERLLTSLGYSDARADTSYGFSQATGYRGWVLNGLSGSDRWSVLRTGYPVPIEFWHHASPRPLVPLTQPLGPTRLDPPVTFPGSTSVVLDTRGRLLQLQSVPLQLDQATAATSGGGNAGSSELAAPATWNALFEAAALPIDQFRQVSSLWTPPTFANDRRAWEGTIPGRADLPIRVEAAAYQGRPVSFAIVWPWTRPLAPNPRRQTDPFWITVFIAFISALLAGAALLAWYHVRIGRADRRGASRLALFVASLHIVSWLVGGHHVADTSVERELLLGVLRPAALAAVSIWVVYVALEPYARRFWPEIMLGWSRLLSGHVRDPRVGIDVLTGLVIGLAWSVVFSLRFILPGAFGYNAPRPLLGTAVVTLRGLDATIAHWLQSTLDQLMPVLSYALLFVLLRLLTRRTWIAVPIGMSLIGVYHSSFGEANAAQYVPLELALETAIVALLTFALIRCGLLVAVVAAVVVQISTTIPLTTDFAHWSAVPSNWTLAAIAACAIWAYHASRGGRSMLAALPKA